MPVIPTYPGVFIDEIPKGGRAITPVATSVTAFLGSAPRGLSNKPVHVRSIAEYVRQFGGLNSGSSMSYSVSQFVQNGGSDAVIV